MPKCNHKKCANETVLKPNSQVYFKLCSVCREKNLSHQNAFKERKKAALKDFEQKVYGGEDNADACKEV